MRDLHTAAELRAILTGMSPTKLALLTLVTSGVEAPQDAAIRLGIAPVTVYHHLTVLKVRGLVQATRRGRCTCYALSPRVHAADMRAALSDASRNPDSPAITKGTSP